MDFTEINTNRLTLRVITPAAYSDIFDNCDDKTIMNILGISSADEVEKEREKYAKGITTYNRSFLHFYVVMPDTEKVIGWCGYHIWYTDHNRAEIGYKIFENKYKRKGYMTEVLAAALHYGFEEMNLYRIEAMAAPENEPSLKLLENFGFSKEGYLREHYLADGVMTDSVLYSLLRNELKS